jgi:HK97 family phage portal protein
LGLIASIKNYLNRDKLTATKLINLLNHGYSLMAINRALYDIPEIRTAINFIAEKVASVPFYHIRADTENNQTILNDRLHFVLTVRANPYQGPQVFWTAAMTTLLLTNNCFIMPDWDDKGNIRALYILPFTQFEFSQSPEGRLIITFASNGPYSFYYDDIVHLQRFPTQKGGAPRQATSNYTTIVSTMQAQAVKDSETSGRIAALLQVKTALKGSDMKKKLDEFKELFLTAENTTGFGMIGAEYDVHKLDMSKTALDTNLLKSVIGYLYNYFGVSTEIISNTANELQYEQFVDNTIKPIVYQIEEELTYKLFSNTEIYHFNRVQAELVDLEISTLSAKTTFYKEMIFGSVMNRNEIRRRLGIPKGPPELDEFALSKNFETLKPGNYVVEDTKKGGEEDGTGTDKEVPANSTAE